MSPSHDQAFAAAKRFIGTHQAEHLQRDADRLIDRCADHVADVFYLSRRAAAQLANQAMSELQAAAGPPA